LFSVKPGGRTVVHRAHQHSSEKPRSARPAEGVGIVYAGDRPTVCVVGRVDPQMVTEVSGIVRGLLAVGVRELVVDLTEAVDGPALQATLCRTRAELAETGGGLRVVRSVVPPHTRLDRRVRGLAVSPGRSALHPLADILDLVGEAVAAVSIAGIALLAELASHPRDVASIDAERTLSRDAHLDAPKDRSGLGRAATRVGDVVE
jgi:hypothetical protein